MSRRELGRTIEQPVRIYNQEIQATDDAIEALHAAERALIHAMRKHDDLPYHARSVESAREAYRTALANELGGRCGSSTPELLAVIAAIS
jgi:hypothetical protein